MTVFMQAGDDDDDEARCRKMIKGKRQIKKKCFVYTPEIPPTVNVPLPTPCPK
jgi:hypothetical protein